MRQSFLRIGSAALFALGIALAGSSAANAESVMKMCGDQWKAAKAAGTTNGETWPQFLAQCREQQKSAGMGGGMAPAPFAPAPTTAQAPMAGKTASQCNAEYAANKAAIRAGGQTKREFVAACRSGNETIPPGSAAAPAPMPAPAPAPAPTQNGSLFPWQQPATPAAAPTPANYGAPPAAAGSASAQQVQYRCPGATVVWVNEHSHIYHFPGTRDYGNTKHGEYMCEADATAAGNRQPATGNRASKNEKHP